MTVANRVWETSVTTGVGNLTLAGAVANYRTFSSQYAQDEVFEYFAVLSGAFENGLGHLDVSGNLVRDVVLDSSNVGALVNFSAGSKDVFVQNGAKTERVQFGRPFNHGLTSSGAVEGSLNGFVPGAGSNLTLSLLRQIGGPYRLSVSAKYRGIQMDISLAGDIGCVGHWALYRVNNLGNAVERVVSCKGSTASNELDLSITTRSQADFEEGDTFLAAGDYYEIYIAGGGATNPKIRGGGSFNYASVMGMESDGTSMRGLKDASNQASLVTALQNPFAFNGAPVNNFSQPFATVLVAI